MKKVIWAAALIAGMTMLAGCTDTKTVFTERSYTTEGAKVSGIYMDVRDREIEVLRSEDQEIHVDYFDSDKEFFDISISDEGVLTMTAAENKEWKDYIGSKADADFRKISLQIPETLLADLIIQTTNEDIILSELTADEVILSANGGNITFEKVSVENALDLNVKNGNINGTIMGGYDDFSIRCDRKKGESNLPSEKKDGDKKLQVSANNGDVNIEFEKS